MTERYYKVEMGNGWCGYDDEFLAVTHNGEDFTMIDALDLYTYVDGGAGLDIGDDEDCDCTMEEYEENIYDNTWIEEIDEEEFIRLRDEESWEVREY